MIIHPEIYAWLNKQSQTEEKKDAHRRRGVQRGDNINKDGAEKAKSSVNYDFDDKDHDQKEIDYLNAKPSNVNFYA